MTALQFAEIVLAIRAQVPVSCTSWGRTVLRNRAVGGKPKSQHIAWTAVDLVSDTEQDKIKLIEVLDDLKNKGKVWYLDEGDHIHVQVY